MPNLIDNSLKFFKSLKLFKTFSIFLNLKICWAIYKKLKGYLGWPMSSVQTKYEMVYSFVANNFPAGRNYSKSSHCFSITFFESSLDSPPFEWEGQGVTTKWVKRRKLEIEVKLWQIQNDLKISIENKGEKGAGNKKHRR